MSSTSPPIRWSLLGFLLAGVWLISWKFSGPELDSAAKIRPRNPLLEVRLEKLFDGDRLEIDIEGLWEMRSHGGDLVSKGDGMRGWLGFEHGKMTVGGWKPTIPHLVLHSFGDAALTLDTHRYRGSLHLRYHAKRNGVARHLEVSLELPLEDYVLGVLIGEMSTGRSGIQEAMRAQAIAARSYAVFKILGGRTMLSSTPSDQRFLSVDYETAAAREAVRNTTGMLLRHGEEYVPAFFHADCGGATSAGEPSGFGTSAVLQQVMEASSTSHVVRPHTWRERLDAEELDKLAQKLEIGEQATGLQILERDSGGRVLRAKLTGNKGSKEIPGEELRRVLSLPSAMIDMMGVLRDGSLIMEGRGRGHGVGLCQVGAQALAKEGWTCVEILEHYYPGASIELLSEPIRPE